MPVDLAAEDGSSSEHIKHEAFVTDGQNGPKNVVARLLTDKTDWP